MRCDFLLYLHFLLEYLLSPSSFIDALLRANLIKPSHRRKCEDAGTQAQADHLDRDRVTILCHILLSISIFSSSPVLQCCRYNIHLFRVRLSPDNIRLVIRASSSVAQGSDILVRSPSSFTATRGSNPSVEPLSDYWLNYQGSNRCFFLHSLKFPSVKLSTSAWYSVPEPSRTPPRDEPLSNDAKMAKLPSHKPEEQDPEAADLAKDHDHAILDARYSSKPTSFDINNIPEGDIEDDLVKERDRTKRRQD